MLSRTSAMVLLNAPQRRKRLVAATLGTAASLCCVPAYKYSLTEQKFGQTYNQKDLLIPTLEAGYRALRLVKTAVLMVLDYEVGNCSTLFQTREELERDENYKYWESEVTLREKGLEDAQLAYAKKENVFKPQLPPEEKKRRKSEQKKVMQEAAEVLAEAEQQLCEIGGESPKSRTHRRAARRLLQLCRENGGVYIKVGQHLANLDYLVPPEYIEVMASLFDEAPKSSFENVCRVIEEEFGQNVDQLFDRFDPKPIASASLAQVHVAYDKESGKKLAIKVQHAGLRETSAGDIFAVSSVVRLIDRLFDDFSFYWIVDEIVPQLPKELDFVREGKNSEKAALHLQKAGLDCVVPKVLWKNTSSRVLTMEFEEGFKATDVEAIEKAGLNKRDVAKLISSVFNSQVFMSAWVHCDPHPANVLLRANKGKPQLVLVDHGLYRAIDDDFRIRYASLWRSLMIADLEGIKDSCQSLGVEKAYPLFAAMLTARPYDEIIERSRTGSLSNPVRLDSQADRAVIRGYAKHFVKDIISLLGLIPKQMLLLLKMNDCLRHIDFALGHPTNTLVVAGKFATRAVYEDEVQKHNRQWKGKLSAWVDYVLIMMRIQIHDFGAWFVQTVSPSKLRF